MSIKRKALRSENRATRNKGGRINISLKERLLRGVTGYRLYYGSLSYALGLCGYCQIIGMIQIYLAKPV